MLQRRAFWTILITLALMAQKPMASEDTSNCMLQNDITAMALDAKHFLSYLETGSNSASVWKLERRLKATATSSLLQRLSSNGHNNLAARAHGFIKQQRQLLFSHEKSGRRTTLATARGMQAQQHLKALRSRAAALPCDAPRVKGDGFGQSASTLSERLVESGVVHFFGVAVLIGSVAAGIFGWWSQISRRRAKRHNCLISCSVTTSAGTEPAVVVNLSRAGAKVHIESDCKIGQRFELNLLGEKVSSRVVRIKKGYVALDFNTLLNTAVLDRALFEDSGLDLSMAKS